MDSWLKDVTLVLLGWTLGLFTLPLATDANSKEKTLYTLYEFKRILERLSNHMRSPARSENRYYELLMEIKPLLERLDVERMGLIFPSYMLNDLITQSLTIFRQFDPYHENCAFHTTQTSVNLMMIWGGVHTHSPDFRIIAKIQGFIGKSFPNRFIEWLSSFVKRIWSRKNLNEEAFIKQSSPQ
jgi:hypothetical protein